MIEAWRKHFNEVRPHSSLGYLTPAELVAKQNAASGKATGRDAAVREGMASPMVTGLMVNPPIKLILVKVNPEGSRDGLNAL